MPKDVLKRAKEKLVVLNIARTELIARLDDLLANSNYLSQKAASDVKKAGNSLKDHLTQDDLVGALRDVFGKEVRQSGTGYTYNHLGEVESAVQSLKQARNSLIKDMDKLSPNSNEYKRLSKEADSIAEFIRRTKAFLETK